MWLWALLPICLAVFGTVGNWTVFAVAVTNGSVNLTEGVPYISQCGSYSPQSCLFSQICNICSFLGNFWTSSALHSLCLRVSALWIVLIRFQQVRDYGNHGQANTASIVLVFISSVRISIVGNFQQSVFERIHLLGAFLAFFLSLANFWLQLFLTYRAQPPQSRCWVGPARTTCCSHCTILVIFNDAVASSQGGYGGLKKHEGLFRRVTVLASTGFHSGAAVCEWALVMLFFCLFSLFVAEFRHINYHLTVREQAIGNDSSSASTEIDDHVANALS